MNLNNKTICFLGDSITEGHGASDVSNCYASLFQKRHPECKVVNLGFSGTRIAEQITKPYNIDNPQWDENPFYTRVNKIPDNTDVICVFGGTNDFGHGDASLGKLGDDTLCTFYGAVRDLITRLINKFPFAKIIFFTPLHRREELEPKKKADGNHTLIEYVNAIRQTCEYFSIPVLDLYKISGLQPEIEIIQQTFMPDRLHPNDNGYKVLTDIIENYLINF